MFLSGLAGFVLAWIIVGIVYFVKNRKRNKSYEWLADIEGITFVVDTYVIELLSKGAFDDYCDSRIILNNMLQFCYGMIDAGWKSEHKEKAARCGITVNTENESLSFTLSPLNLPE
jgi:hypothetical protein